MTGIDGQQRVSPGAVFGRDERAGVRRAVTVRTTNLPKTPPGPGRSHPYFPRPDPGADLLPDRHPYVIGPDGRQPLTKAFAAEMPLLSIALFDSTGLGTLPGKTM